MRFGRMALVSLHQWPPVVMSILVRPLRKRFLGMAPSGRVLVVLEIIGTIGYRVGAICPLIETRKARGHVRCFPGDDEEMLPNHSHRPGGSFNSSSNGLNPRRIKDQSFLPKFLARPEIRPPRAAVSREVYYVTMPENRGQNDYMGISRIPLAPWLIVMILMVLA